MEALVAMTVVAARLLVSGAVQGVGYRAWTTRAARALGLCGFVRNLDDGRVEIVAQGTVSALDSLVSQCGQGPPSARVDDQRNLREQAKNLADDDECARSAIASALRYIRTRKDQMRYASHHQANLPIGSGATESTCWQMQQRVKLPGQSWEPPGLRGVLAIRGLVLSERWEPAWNHYAESHRYEVNAVL